MTYDGDIKLQPTPDGGATVWQAGQLAMDGGLSTAVYISLYTLTGWWADSTLGSELEILEAESLTNSLKNDYAEEARRALAWLIDEGIAKSVVVEAEIHGPERINMLITITEPDGTESTYRYARTWRATEEAL